MNDMSTESEKVIRDFLGQPISIGDIIVYPGHKGVKTWMNKSQVFDIQDDGSIIIKRENGMIKKLVRLDRVVVVTKQLGLLQKFGSEVPVKRETETSDTGYRHQYD